MNNTLECLQKARAKITPPGTWLKRMLAKDIDGKEVWAEDPTAVAWCSLGVLTSLREEYSFAAVDEALKALRVATGSSFDIVDWNNAPERTQAEVLEGFDKAIEYVKTNKA